MERIIIGTGRCGSTLLSDLMSLHPEIMVLSEFFRALDPAQGWPSDRDVEPEEFIEILKREDGVSPVYMAHNFRIGEVLIDVESEKHKHPGFISRPTLTFIAMRFLSEEPDALFAEVLEQVRTYPSQSLHGHFTALIDWLQAKFHKKYWIERSGTSTNIFPQLRAVFPNARYVHIHRDGMETSLSMRNHVNMALLASLHMNPLGDRALRRALDLSLPARENPLLKRLEQPMAVEKYGEYWCYSLMLTYRELGHLRPDQWLDVRFEDLVDDPLSTLARIANFFAIPADQDWLDKAQGKIRKMPPRASELSAAERERLHHSCLPGEILVGNDPGVSPADIANGKLVKWRRELAGR